VIRARRLLIKADVCEWVKDARFIIACSGKSAILVVAHGLLLWLTF
jgi:hypothetical protein